MFDLRSLVLTFLFLLLSVSLTAQNSATSGNLKGNVFDDEGEPLINATVAVYKNDSLLTGTVTDTQGSFSLQLDPGSYSIEITFLAFADVRRQITIKSGERLDLGVITLQPTEAELDEVEVRGERSYMEMNFDSRSFNVQDDITSLGGSALDVLDNVPSISTDFEGNVSLRGNQGVQILINGRPSNLVRNGTDALSSIPSGLIEEVKIITNPSARYAANGTGGIIDIILVDGAELGFNGTVRANAGYPQDYSLGTNVNYQKKRINWFADAQVEYESEPETGNTFQSFSNDTTYAYSESSETDETEKEVSFNIGADIFLDNDQIVTISSRINLENQTEDRNVNYIDYNPDNDQVYQSANENWGIIQETEREVLEDETENDFDVRVQYEKKFNKNRDHRLVADLDFEFGQENGKINFDQIVQQGSGTAVQQRTNAGEVYREARFDVDYVQPLGESGKLEAGLRYDYEWQDNDYLVEEFQNGTWVRSGQDIGPADNFIYSENINALYGIYSGEIKPFTYQIGLRVENTRISSRLDESGTSSSQDYTNFFPSAFLSYTINELNSVQLSYSRRISRPWSGQLLPFAEIENDRNREVGNPDLKPEFSNSYEAGYLRYWETGSVLTSFYYRHRTDVIEDVSTIDNGITTETPINLATEDAWGVEFSADQKLSTGLQLSGSLNIYQSNREGSFQNQVYQSESETFTSRVRVRWQFLDGWNFQSYITYRGAQQTTQGTRAGRSFVGTGLSKDFLDDKANISLNIRDLFNSRNSDREIIQPFSYTNSKYSWSSRAFRLNLRYNFGGK
ncbi:MAG: outer membrane beta-barrel family protein [Balneola sp.]